MTPAAGGREDRVIERPAFVEDRHLKYLDTLRETGITNMYGSPTYVMRAFKVERDRAIAIVSYWMRTFSKRHPR